MKIKKFLALLLVMLMVISSLPLSVFAETAAENTAVTAGEQVTEETVSGTEEAETTSNSTEDASAEEPVLTTAADTTTDGTYMYNVPYVDVDAQGNRTTKICEKALILKGCIEDDVAINQSWVVVPNNSETVQYGSKFEITGDVHIILMDGGKLLSSQSGIQIYSGKSLTVYGQQEQTGTLTAWNQFPNKETDLAGIGCLGSGNYGNLTINGGNIEALGNQYGAGIGNGGIESNGLNVIINYGNVEAKSKFCAEGIGGNCNITINGGNVTATGHYDNAGIGNSNTQANHITINGGTITAYGNEDEKTSASTYEGAAGIGGGVTINGGTVNAYGRLGGAGIGGSTTSKGSDITINGGTVYAKGGMGGAGIGGGKNQNGENITISGGTVIAEGSTGGAGIGGGDYGHGQNITITGNCKVTAYGEKNAAGIGGGYLGSGSGITITDATVTADGGYAGAGIGGGYSAHGQNISISGSKVEADGGVYAAGIGGGYKGNGSDITITGDDVKAEAGAFFNDNNAIGAGKEGSASNIYVNCYLAAQTQETSEIYASDLALPKSGDVSALLTGKYYLRLVKLPEITYLDFENGSYVEKKLADYRTITADTTELADDVYVLTQDLTMDHSLKITGDVKLILFNQHVLKISGVADGEAGILVTNTSNPENKLTICDDGSSGTGIEVTGGKNAAGIGGGKNQNGSAIVINGGNISVKGGENGAGIGGGQSGKGTEITINGGNITTTGGENGAGIGGGYGRHGADITINGGQITAEGGNGGAGIGGGENQGGFDIKINGGNITAACGGEYTSAIGGGKLSGSSDITVSTSCVVRADNQNPPQTIIENTGADLWEALHYQSYASVRECVDANYLDAEGQVQHIMATPLLGNMTTLEEGWYVVNKDITYGHQLKISGEVHLILTDGCTLSVTGNDSQAAIEVTNTNTNNLKNRLTVYGQSGGTGTLTVTGGSNAAGIGGNENENGSGITINGGRILANGGMRGAGIGGGNGKEGVQIIINGGNVSAEGGRFSAGIGGGYYGAASDILINGGTVQAKGTDLGAGIGGGYYSTGSQIAINGGNITATGGTDGGAGIGGGNRGDGTGIVINGGTVTVEGGKKATGIGSGSNGSSTDIIIAQYLTVKAGEDAQTAVTLLNDGKDLSGDLTGKTYAQTADMITVENDRVLVYATDAENSVVKATAPASVFYNGKTQASSVLKPAYLADTYDSILTKSDDYQNKADVTASLQELTNAIKSIYCKVDGTAKDLLDTADADQLKAAIKVITADIKSLKGTYYGNLATDLAASLSLNNGEFNSSETSSASIDAALRMLYTSEPEGKSVITGEVTETYGDAFYTALLNTGAQYLKDETLSKDIFILYEGGEAYGFNFNSETLDARTGFNETAYNTYESGYLLVNTAMVYDLRNHQNQLNAIKALQAAAVSDHFTEAEKTAIKNEMVTLETTLGMTLEQAKSKHENAILADQEKIDALKAQYANVRDAWQDSEEDLAIEKDELTSSEIVFCYRNGNYYNRILKTAYVNDGVPNVESTVASDFLIQNSAGYQAQVKEIYMKDDRSRANSLYADAASVSDLANMDSWAKVCKTNLNEEIAKAFIIEDSEASANADIAVTTNQADDTCLGIYANGEQSAAKNGNIVSFTRQVTYIQNGSWEDKNTMTRKWRASDGALSEADTDIDSTVLVLYNAELGGGDDEEENSITSSNVNTGILVGDLFGAVLPVLCIIAALITSVIWMDRKSAAKRQQK